MNTQPYWIASTEQPQYPKLQAHSLTVDVAVIGGGISGITTAFLLKDSGLKIAVLEARQILKGATGHTTAKITIQHELIYHTLIKNFGEEQAKQYARANEAALEQIRKWVQEKRIECDFSNETAYLYTQEESSEYQLQLEQELKATQQLGIETFYTDQTDLPFDVKGAIGLENQAQFHPRKYLLHLVKELTEQGHFLFEKTRVLDLIGDGPYTVITDQGSLKAKKIVIASHFPIYDGRGLYFTRMYTERSYVIAAKVKESLPKGMYINIEQPTRSFRRLPTEKGELLLIGGNEHKTGYGGNTEKHYQNLMDYANGIYTVEEIPFQWSAQDCMTVDQVPYIGPLTSKTKDIYVATGFRKWGMTTGTAAGLILSDLILEKESPWGEVFLPSRWKPKAAIKEFLLQNAEVAQEFISGKITEKKKNPTCSHLGCQLIWNEAEGTWDCPCHGSRFEEEGEVIEGPAIERYKE